ncbi:MAG: hypothetical protein E7470_02170 [Ruminococcaceae bacterium]|nr:hypothetical protein [Oscillospiraceae bacterium]
MKRVCAIILLAASVIALFAGCQEPYDPNVLYDEPLSEELKQEINHALILQCDTKINWEYFDPYYGYPWYGTINNCIILRTPDPDNSFMPTSGLVEVADYSFVWSWGFGLHVYRDGEACTLKEAYEREWLTKEQIGKIYEKHNRFYEGLLRIYADSHDPSAYHPDYLSIKPIPKETKQKIDSALSAQYNVNVNWDDASSYIGTINYCTILKTVKSENQAAPFHDSLTIADYAFEWHEPFNLYAYRDGEVCELKEAYEKGWLTKIQIGKIYERHNELFAPWVEE